MPTSIIQILGVLAAMAAVGVMAWVYRNGRFLGTQYGLGALLARAAPKGDGRPFQRLMCVGLHTAVVGLLLGAFYGCATHAFRQVPVAEKSSVIFAVDASNSMAGAETQAWVRRQINRYHDAWSERAMSAAFVSSIVIDPDFIATGKRASSPISPIVRIAVAMRISRIVKPPRRSRRRSSRRKSVRATINRPPRP